MTDGTCTKKVLVEHEDSFRVTFASGGNVASDFKAVTEAAATQLSVPPTDLICDWI